MILTILCVTVVLGLGWVTGILHGFGIDIEMVLITWMLYSFAFIIITMVVVAGVLV